MWFYYGLYGSVTPELPISTMPFGKEIFCFFLKANETTRSMRTFVWILFKTSAEKSQTSRRLKNKTVIR